MGTGLGHYIPIVAYLGFWVMCIVSLAGKPIYGLYYMLPFLPYRTMRYHFLDYPLGANVLTILVLCVFIGALLKGKRPPKSKLIWIWLAFGIYMYLSMWMGAGLGNAPAPLWLSAPNFTTWKDYMLIPLMAAEQFGVNTLARAMAIILPANTIGQTWLPFFVSALRERLGNYVALTAAVFAIAMLGVLAVAFIPL